MAQDAILPHKNDGSPDDLRLLLSYYLIATLGNDADSPLPVEAGDPLTFHVLGDGPLNRYDHMLRLLNEADDAVTDTIVHRTVDYDWIEFHEVVWPWKNRVGRIMRRLGIDDAAAAAWTPGTPGAPLSDASWEWPMMPNPDYPAPGEPSQIPWNEHPDFSVSAVKWHLSFLSPNAAGKSVDHNFQDYNTVTGRYCMANDEKCNVWVEQDPDGYYQVTFARWTLHKEGEPANYAYTMADRSIAGLGSHDPLTAPKTTGSWNIRDPWDLGDYDSYEVEIEPLVSGHFIAFWAWYETVEEHAVPDMRTWLGITEENVDVPIVKRYADGTAAADGVIPARRVTLDPPAFTMTLRSAWYPVPGSMPPYQSQACYSYGGFLGISRNLGVLPYGILPNILGEPDATGRQAPWGSVDATIDGSPLTETAEMGVMIAGDYNAVYVWVGLMGELGTGFRQMHDTWYHDFMPLSRWDIAGGAIPPTFIAPAQPYHSVPPGGVPIAIGYMLGWFWPAGDARVQFHAIRSDDADAHDPRANTAAASVAAYLAAGTGLVYDGPFGQLPRPCSGATGTMLGHDITASTFYTFDAVTRPDGVIVAALVWADASAVVWEARQVEGVWEATTVWSGPAADALPPDVWAEFTAPLPPILTYRFLLPDWPHPTGVLSLGGAHLIFAARDRKNDRKYRTPGRPPIVTSFGWRDD